MKTEAEILVEISGMTRVEIEERIESCKYVANKILTSGSSYAFMANDVLKEISILEEYLNRKVR